MNITAVVLAGGRGSRMNDADKALVEFRGKPLIDHVIDRIADAVDDIIISYNRSDEAYGALPYRHYKDERTGFLGPLSGILACAPHVTTDRTFVVPCDMPLIPEDTVQRLLKGLEGHDLAIAHDGQRMQPLVLLARTAILVPSITAYMDEGNLSATEWCRSQDHAIIQFDDAEDAFTNINELHQLD